MDQTFRMGISIKNKISLTKVGDTTMGFQFKKVLQNSNFLIAYTRHMKFLEQVNINKRFDKIWGNQNKGPPSNGSVKILNF